jgi:hypothetical protein
LTPVTQVIKWYRCNIGKLKYLTDKYTSLSILMPSN